LQCNYMVCTYALFNQFSGLIDAFGLTAAGQRAIGWTRNRPIAAGDDFFSERPVHLGT